MRNVNTLTLPTGVVLTLSFILTMRNVNMYKGDENKVFDVSFILTMRNVNFILLYTLTNFFLVLY